MERGFDYNFDITATSGITPADREREQEENAPTYDREDDWILSLAAGIERQNWFAKWANDEINGVVEPMFTPDISYNPIDDDQNYGYDPSQMSQAQSAEEAAYIRGQIETEWAQLRRINGDGWGMVGEVYGAIFRPETALAMAVPGIGWARVAAIEGIAETASELALHEQQRTRTAQESLFNIGITTATVGLLGKASEWATQSSKIPKATTKPGAVDDLAQGDSAGAARRTASADDAELAGAGGIENLAIGPMARLSRTQSNTAREVADELADKSFYTQGMVDGRTTGTTIEAEANASLGELVTHLDHVKKLGKESGLQGRTLGVFPTLSRFHEEVGKAMRSGDVHANPKVQEAAQYLRENVFNKRADTARELGHEFGQSRFAKGYLPRVYNRAKIMQNYGDLKSKLVSHYRKAFTGQMSEEAAAARAANQEAIEKAAARIEELTPKIEEITRIKKRTAKQTVQLQRMRDELRKVTARHEKALAKVDPKARLSLLERQYAALERRRKAKAKGSRSKAEIAKRTRLKNEIDSLQKATVETKAAEAVRKQMMDRADVERAADRAAKDTIENMLGGLPSSHGVGSALPKAMRQRTVALTDRMLEDFLEQDVSVLSMQYASSMDPYLLMKQRFGDAMIGDKIEQIVKEYGELIDKAPNEKARKALRKQRDSDVADIEAMRDRILHRVQRGVAPGSSAEKVIQAVKTFNISTQLGGIVLSSLPDVARPLMAYGLRSYVKGWGKAIASIGSGASNAQVKRMGVAAQRALNSRLLDMADLAEQPVGNAVVDTMKTVWGKVSLFDAWTDAMETVTAQAAMDWTLRMGEKVRAGKALSRSERMKIARMGFDETDVGKFYDEALRTGGARDSDLWYANTLEWSDPELGKMFEAGVGSDVRRAIVRIGVGDKPLLMDNAYASLALQYMSFATAATNRMLVAGMQQRDISLAMGIMSSLALGATVGASKAWLRGEDPRNWDEDKWLMESLDRTGMLGLWNIPMNILVRPYLLDDVSSRYIHRGMESLIAGSTVSQLGRAGKLMGAAMEGEVEQAGEQALRLTPFVSNALHIRQLMQQMGE